MIGGNVYTPVSLTSSYFMSGRFMAVEQEEGEHSTDTMTIEMKIAQIFPRVVGVIIFLSSLCMLFMARNRRDQLFQRLVIGKLNKNNLCVYPQSLCGLK